MRVASDRSVVNRPLSRAGERGDCRASTRWLRAAGLLALLVGGWVGCRCRPEPPKAESDAKPSLRLVLFSTVAGALEPCGCVKDMLGGVDHAAAYVSAQANLPTLALAAGPTLFMDPALAPERRAQDVWKAEAIAESLRHMHVQAWAPGANDFAAGGQELARLTTGGPTLLAANLKSSAVKLQSSAVYHVGALTVGVTALSLPKHAQHLPDGVDSLDTRAALANAVADLDRQHVALRVLLLALPRGDALRLIESVPNFHVALLGKPADQGDGNDPPSAPIRVGKTLVLEAQNHLQSFYTLDLFVKNGSFDFENADERLEQREDLRARIGDLERRIEQAQAQTGVREEDLAARRKDLQQLRAELATLDAAQSTPKGSYFRARRVEVREALGSDQSVAHELSRYYRRVNEHNRVAFADEAPLPAAQGASSYVGIAQCATCHQPEYAFWQKTQHAQAYATLAHQYKEFNLDCVSCHVTGYRQPGGSTVVHVAGLENVQCEVCHGPGSKHVANPGDRSLIVAKPERSLCASKCHHLPHVNADWNADVSFEKIVGPGHGR